jgi:ceramide glucosyltransferase
LVVRDRDWLRTSLLFPLRDLFGFFYWAASYANNQIVWRNQLYRLAPGGFMTAEDGEEEAKSAPAFTA